MAGHCTDTKEIQFLDNSAKMDDLDFKYDQEYYPEDNELPDPQQNPLIFGSKVVLQKVGIAPVDLPVKVVRRDGTIQELHAKVSLYGSLDNAEAKGLNLSRFYILMHDKVADHLSIDGLKDVLQDMSSKQGAKNSYCKMRFSYPWVQEALRTREELPDDAPDSEVFKVVDGVKLSHKKKMGHIFYECELEAQLRDGEYKFYLTVDYMYSSTCPCSFELAHDARIRRKKAANGHSQRSIATIKVQFDPNNIVWIEDVVELARKYIPTEVVVVCKRRDEQAFAELNGSNLLFTEDAARLLYQGLDEWFNAGKISDFSIVTNHIESLHPWSAIAVVYKGVDGGLR
jgi:GTP cyclohydrolase I